MDRSVSGYHAEAIAARYLWGAEYARQNGGQMDFYESLPESRKAICRCFVDEIKRCQRRDPTQPRRAADE